MRYRHIFFDLDGTLTDSKPGILNAFAHALEVMGLKADPQALEQFIGPPLRDTFRGYFGLDDDAVERAVTAYRQYYREKGMFENAPYPGVPEMLATLAEAGAELVLATSKAAFFADAIMKHFGLVRYFSFLGASDPGKGRSSKADVLEYALENSAARDLKDCVLVGDTRYDVEGARIVGMECVGAGYGYGGEERLREAGASRIAPTVADLEKLLLS